MIAQPAQGSSNAPPVVGAGSVHGAQPIGRGAAVGTGLAMLGIEPFGLVPFVLALGMKKESAVAGEILHLFQPRDGALAGSANLLRVGVTRVNTREGFEHCGGDRYIRAGALALQTGTGRQVPP